MVPPQLACDSHMHVFGPTDRYPGAPTRQYTPTDMPFARYRPLARELGMGRAVLVQPSAYGTDNRCLLDTLREHPDSTRGIVVIDPDIDDADMDAMHALGVRGVRMNLMNPRVTDADAARAMLTAIASRIERLGWHIQIYADPRVFASIGAAIRGLHTPVVLDHMAGVHDDQSVHDPDFRSVLAILEAGRCWIKLSGADIVTKFKDDVTGAAPYLRTLIAANPHRLVWGTDWPHLVHHSGATGDASPVAGYRPVSERALFDLLAECAGDVETLERILVSNPARLYAFSH